MPGLICGILFRVASKVQKKNYVVIVVNKYDIQLELWHEYTVSEPVDTPSIYECEILTAFVL